VFSVKLSLIPEDGAYAEKGLCLAFKDFGLEEPFVGPGLALDYELRRIPPSQILASVKASALIQLECSRCLKGFETLAVSEFTAQFEPKPEAPMNERGRDLEDPELSLVFFEGDRLPLGEEVRQEMVLKIPFAPLCEPLCKGLCPHCGVNRNRQRCGCAPEPKVNPFAGLKKLFNQSKEN
jgi:uncharacterized metal-binding protein YceD (DUF177 family)